jgi:proline iminopeptidase
MKTIEFNLIPFEGVAPNKSLDASGGSVFLNLIRPAMLESIRAAASTQPFGVYSNNVSVRIKGGGRVEGKQQHWSMRITLLLAVHMILPLSGSSQTTVNSTALTMPAYGNLPAQEGYFSGADDAQLFYRIVGKGRTTIVFLHGGPGLGIDDGGYNLEAIAAKGFRFIMYDQRGGGRSDLVTDKSKLGIDYYVRDLEALRQHFRLRKMNVIGLSWGSAIAAFYASAYPKNVKRIVYLSPMPPTEEFAKQRSQKIRSLIDSKTLVEINEVHKSSKSASDADLPRVCRELNAYLDRLYVADPSHLVRARGDTCSYKPQAIRGSQNTTDAAIKSLGHWNFQSMLRQINVPALVIEGEKSNVPLDATEAWAGWLKDARLLLIRNAGHMNWVDQPEEVISSMSAFFRGRRVKNAK